MILCEWHYTLPVAFSIWGWDFELTFAYLADDTFAHKVAGTWVETLDCLLDTYSEIGDVLPTLTQYKTLVPKYPCIRIHLENYYCAVLEFHRKALDVFSRPSE